MHNKKNDKDSHIDILDIRKRNTKYKNKTKINNKSTYKIKIYETIKRFFDILVSFLGLIILSPFLLIVSLIIKLESKGNVIFSQERIGKDVKTFKIYKFRSMKLNAPDKSDRDFKDVSDYTTKVGKFIRKTSIDELPQLYNILKGEMSFVGPRPFIVNEGNINILRAENGVLTIKPGLTGWAQVNDRNTDNHDDKLGMDIYYLKNRSLFLDFKIFVKTFFTSIGR